MSPTYTTIKEAPLRTGTELSNTPFLLYPENEAFLRGESAPLTLLKLRHRYPLYDLASHFLSILLVATGLVFLESTGMAMTDALLPIGLLIVGVMLVITLLERGLNLYLNRRLTHRFRREGKIVQGEWVGSEPASGAFAWRYRKMVYQVTTPSDEIVQGDFLERDLFSLSKRIPMAGTPVVILYFSNREQYMV